MNRRSLLALPVVLVALTACSTTVTGHGRPGSPAGSSASGSSSSSSGSGGGSGSIDPADLEGKLLPAPTGSRPWGDSWSDDTTPTTAEFVARVYAAADRSAAQAKLEAQGISAIAHRTWFATDSNQADDVLLLFDSVDGAKSRFSSATSAQDGDGRTAVTVPGVPDAEGYTDPGLDSLGNSRTIFYLQRGAVVVELFYYSPASYKADDANTWLTGQAALL